MPYKKPCKACQQSAIVGEIIATVQSVDHLDPTVVSMGELKDILRAMMKVSAKLVRLI